MKKSMVLQRLFSLVLAVVLACSGFTGALAAELDTSDAAINAAKTAMDVAKTALDAAAAELAKADANVATAQENLAAAEKALTDAGLSPDAAESETVTNLKNQIAELQKQIDGGAVADLTAQSAQAVSEMAANAREIAAAKKAAEDAAAKVVEQTAAVNSIGSKIDQLQMDITNNNTKKTNNEFAITNAENELAGMDSQLADLEKGITDADAAVKALQSLQSSLTSAQDELAALKSQLLDEEAALDEKDQLLEDERTALGEKETALGKELEKLNAAKAAEKIADDALQAAKNALDDLDNLLTIAEQAEAKAAELQIQYDNASGLNKGVIAAKLTAAKLTAEGARATYSAALENKPALDAALAKAESELTAKQKDTADAQAAWDKANEELLAAQQAVKDAQTALEEQQKAIKEKNDAIVEQEKIVSDALAEVNAALAGSPEEQMAAAQAKYDKDAPSIETRKDELKKKIANLKDENLTIDSENATKATEKSALETTKSEQASVLADLEAAAKIADDDYAAKVKAGEEIDAKIKAIAAEIKKITNDLQKQMEDLQEQLQNAQTGNDALIVNYNAAKAALEKALAYQKTMGLAYTGAKVAYDEAASLYAQLTGSTSCAHDKYQINAFGNVFCPLKTVGLCTHNLGKCCSAMSTSMIADNINAYIAAGDFQGLASEAKSVYNQLTNLVNAYEELPESSRDAVNSAINSLVKKAANLVGDKLLGEENWAKLKELGDTLLNADEIAGKVQNVVNQVKAEVEAAVKAAVSSGDFSDLKEVIAKAEAALEKIKPYFPELDFDLAGMKDAAMEYAKQYLQQIKDEITNASADLEKVAELMKKAIAKLEALKDQVPGCDELQELINDLKNKVSEIVNNNYEEYLDQLKAAIADKIDECIAKGNLDEIVKLVKRAIAKAEELKDKLPTNAELEALLKEFKNKVNGFINGGYEEYVEAAKAQIKELLASALDNDCYEYIAAKAAELKAKVEKLLSEIHVCEESAEEVAKLVKGWVEEFIADCTEYVESKLEGVTCEDVKAKLEKIADAIEKAMGWRPNCDLTEEEIKAFIAELIEKAKDCIKDHCGIIEDLIKEILGHVLVVNEAVEPTCYQTGLTEGLSCICGYVYKAQEVIPATGNHVYCEGEVTTDPTCITPGVKTFHCETEGCVASYTEAVAATGKHVYDSEVVDEPTCYTEGTERFFCVADENCTAGYSQPIAATGKHVWDEGVTTAPDCIHEGKTVYTCTTEGCGASYEEPIAATGKHVWNEGVTTAPSCFKDGKTVYTCTTEGCGASYEEAIAATGKHVWNEGVRTEPDCIHEGKIVYTCTTEGCGATYTEVIAATGEHAWTKTSTVAATCTTGGKKHYACATEGCTATKTCETGRLGHSYDIWTSNQNGTHSVTCQRYCGHVATVNCDVIEAVLSEELTMAVCMVCGDYLDASFALVADATIEAVDKNALPKGKQVVRGMAAPADGVLYAFTAAYECNGKVNPFNGLVSVTVPVDEEIAEFKVIRVIAEANAEEGEELQVEIPYTLEDGKLTVETDDAAIFLLVPVA